MARQKMKWVLLGGFVGAFLACAAPAGARSAEQTIVLKNEKLRLELDSRSGAFLKLDNPVLSMPLLGGSPSLDAPPWVVILQEERNGPFVPCETFRGFDATVRGSSVHLEWEVREGLRVRATLTLGEEADFLQMTCRVINETDSIVAGIDFPVIRGIETLGRSVRDTYLAHPVSGGFLFRAPFQTFLGTNRLRHSTYPEGFAGCGMQFFSYYVQDEGGFYFACHDPGDAAKQFNFFREPQGLVASIRHWSGDLNKGNDLHADYPILIASMNEGNWYAAAERYRDWATGEGPGHPDWCGRGRLEDRVHRGDASRWLSEEVGFCTFGISSSQDVSRWIDAFHGIADIPVFHVLGYDWAAWAEPRIGALMKYSEIQKRLDGSDDRRTAEILLESFGECTENDVQNPAVLRSALEGAGVPTVSLSDSVLQEVFRFYWTHRLESGLDGNPAEWFPARFHPENLKAIEENGDYFAPFLFDFFAYGHDLDRYGLLTPERRETAPNRFLDRWMHPATGYWQAFHAGRDARVVEENGADAVYYDISASNIGLYSDRDDLGCPAGWGGCLTEAYRNVYRESEKAVHAVSGDFIPRGTEVMIENYLGVIDFSQWRSGGELQGDMEGEQFLDLEKSRLAGQIPLWAYVYHEYGPVKMDGDCKLSEEFGDYFYYIVSRMCLEGSLLELNYEFSSLERFSGIDGSSLHLTYNRTVFVDEDPFDADPEKCAFLKQAAVARTRTARKYLAYGRMARPFRVVPEVEDVTLDWYHYNDIHGRLEAGLQTVPSVVHTVWTYQDLSLGALFVNLDEVPRFIDIAFDLAPYGLSEDALVMTLTDTEGRKNVLGEVRIHGNEVRLSLEPRHIYLLEIAR